jgi:hypothetical protein
VTAWAVSMTLFLTGGLLGRYVVLSHPGPRDGTADDRRRRKHTGDALLAIACALLAVGALIQGWWWAALPAAVTCAIFAACWVTWAPYGRPGAER